MQCHRCGEGLSESVLFCPNCGSPQVRFEAQSEGEGVAAAARLPQPPVRAHGVSWRDATIAALLVAIPTGILSSALAWGCCLWVAGGAVLSIALYRRRAPGFALDTRSGLRIGALAGLITAYTSVAATAIWRVFSRFALHHGTEIDRFYDSVIQQSTALVQSNPEAQAQWHSYVHFLLSPDGRAVYTLMNAVTTSAAIILFSAAGGALGVRLFAAQRGRLSNS